MVAKGSESLPKTDVISEFYMIYMIWSKLKLKYNRFNSKL